MIYAYCRVSTTHQKLTRPITNIKNGAVIGYKYFEFGTDYSSSTMKFFAKINGAGCKAKIRILLDDYEAGEEIMLISSLAYTFSKAR